MQEPLITELLPNETFFDMILVEGGTFTMGSQEEEAFNREKPAHPVEIDDFYIGKFPVTQDVWMAIMDENPSYFIGKKRPVEMVSWDDANLFVSKINSVMGMEDGMEYRLPTEAEWEFAAIGGNMSEGFEYAGGDDLDDLGWFEENSSGETKEVGLKEPNELGIYDMNGNIYEWCHDWYSRIYYQTCHTSGIVRNPKGPKFGAGRVGRGGYWFSKSDVCKNRFRLNFEPDSKLLFLGFRLVLAEKR